MCVVCVARVPFSFFFFLEFRSFLSFPFVVQHTAAEYARMLGSGVQYVTPRDYCEYIISHTTHHTHTAITRVVCLRLQNWEWYETMNISHCATPQPHFGWNTCSYCTFRSLLMLMLPSPYSFIVCQRARVFVQNDCVYICMFNAILGFFHVGCLFLYALRRSTCVSRKLISRLDDQKKPLYAAAFYMQHSKPMESMLVLLWGFQHYDVDFIICQQEEAASTSTGNTDTAERIERALLTSSSIFHW